MGMNFRKSFKVAPGVKVNLGKKSAGVSIGGKYGGISMNTKSGTRARVSAPGTGMSYSTKIGGSKAKTTSHNNCSTISTPTKSCPKNKWISLLLCIFTVCGHKFYEGKTGMGILYLLTVGLFGIGWLIDIIILLAKPNTYYI